MVGVSLLYSTPLYSAVNGSSASEAPFQWQVRLALAEASKQLIEVAA